MKPLKVYVAGASSEIERAEAVIAKLKAAGIEVTCTWPESVRKAGHGNPSWWPQRQRRSVALTCLAEVDKAQALLLLQPATGKTTIGAWGELCYAHAKDKWIVWSAGGEAINNSVFTGLASIATTDDAAIEKLITLYSGVSLYEPGEDS